MAAETIAKSILVSILWTWQELAVSFAPRGPL
jgi:hypothetical protein